MRCLSRSQFCCLTIDSVSSAAQYVSEEPYRLMKHAPIDRARGPQQDLAGPRCHIALTFHAFSAKAWEKLGVAWIGIILCITTMPWSNFTGHSHWTKVLWVPFAEACLKLWFAGDVIGNILLFLPLGWCVIHARPHRRHNHLGRIALAAVALSFSVELFQVFSHERSPAMTDVCTNTAGAVIGALLAARRQRIEREKLSQNERSWPLDRAA